MAGQTEIGLRVDGGVRDSGVRDSGAAAGH
jgi:hypothetical protein